jgi:hypothetical protein
MTKQCLYGIHDWSPEWGRIVRDAGVGGWCVTTHALCEEKSYDFRPLAEYGITPIARLNLGYFPVGTIPQPSGYADFAEACRTFVQASPGCSRWIIGNEPNHSQERPSGAPIQPEDYADCFLRARAAIREVQPEAEVIVAAVAPWNVETGDWLLYYSQLLQALGDDADGLALHAYTHGADPGLIGSEATMQGEYAARRWHFRTYRDTLSVVPQSLRHLPVYLTEFNQGDGAWRDVNLGFVQKAYVEIAEWNRQPDTQKIHCLCLYRWLPYDRWTISDKAQVQADFRAAVDQRHRSPIAQAAPTLADAPQAVYLPSIPGARPPATSPQLSARRWDDRLTQRQVELREPAGLSPGQTYWRLVDTRYLTEKEHIFVEVLDEQGRRLPGIKVAFFWADNPTGVIRFSEAKPGEPWATNFPMHAMGRAYGCRIADGLPSDEVFGMGLGAVEDVLEDGDFDYADHISFGLTFQRTAVPAAAPLEMPLYTAKVVAAVLNVRQGPGTGFLPVDQLTAEARVSVYELRDGWARIGPNRWVHADYLFRLPAGAPLVSPAPDGATGADDGAAIHPLAVDAYAAYAVLAVESGGQGRNPDGSLKIRFEAHVFQRELRDDATFSRHFRVNRDNLLEAWMRADPDDAWQPIHTGRQTDEYAALAIARKLNETAALRSMSFGAAQVMGFNHARAGFPTVQAMVDALSRDENYHYIAFFNYLLTADGLIEAMRRRDWQTVARLYNGQGLEHIYVPKLETAYRKAVGE